VSEQVIKNGTIILGGYNVSGQHNTVDLTVSADMLDKTVFNSSFRKRKAGLSDVSFTHSGFFGTTDTDKQIYDRVGSSDAPCTVCPNTGSVQGRAFMFDNVWSEYTLGGSIGDLLSFNGACAGAGPIVRGLLGINKAIAASTQSTALNLGVGATTDYIMANLHITSFTSGPHKADLVGSCSSGFGSKSTFLSFTATGITAYTGTTKADTAKGFFRFEFTSTRVGGVNMTVFGAAGKKNVRTT